MAEYVQKDWRDRVTVNTEEEQLARQEEALFHSAKSGSLFEPDMTQKEWEKFCELARIEEEERRARIPKQHSVLTKKDRRLLRKASESVKNPGVRKVIERREELARQVRPQCVDPNDDDFEQQILEELGMSEEEFMAVNKSLGQISEEDWQALEERNKPQEE